MRELSVFIDESGDFGPLTPHSPYYILGFVFHDQSKSIGESLRKIHERLRNQGLRADHAVHTGPLMRRENDYRLMPIQERRSVFRALMDFFRASDIRQKSWVFDKREVGDADRLVGRMSRELGSFIRDHMQYLQAWDHIVIYYDSGQKELTNLVNSVFSSHLSNVEVRKVSPTDYTLFQVADLVCTMALLEAKADSGSLSKSEEEFFRTPKASAVRALRKGYFKTMDAKEFR